MVDDSHAHTLEHWGSKNKEYWTAQDVVEILAGGPDNIGETDFDWIDDVKERLAGAVSGKDITGSHNVNGHTLMKRDELVKWARENIEHFPFEPSDFPKVTKSKYPAKAENTQLKLIGLMAMAMAESEDPGKKEKDEPKACYKNGNPNVDGIARICVKQLQPLEAEAIDSTGLKKSNIREMITAGIASGVAALQDFDGTAVELSEWRELINKVYKKLNS